MGEVFNAVYDKFYEGDDRGMSDLAFKLNDQHFLKIDAAAKKLDEVAHAVDKVIEAEMALDEWREFFKGGNCHACGKLIVTALEENLAIANAEFDKV